MGSWRLHLRSDKSLEEVPTANSLPQKALVLVRFSPPVFAFLAAPRKGRMAKAKWNPRVPVGLNWMGPSCKAIKQGNAVVAWIQSDLILLGYLKGVGPRGLAAGRGL